METESGRTRTLTIADHTRIELKDDFPGTKADLQVGTKVKAKFDPTTGSAFKIEVEDGKEDEDGDEDDGSEGPNVKVTQKENPYVFVPDAYEFELGKTYTLVFESTDEFHTFNVDELGIEIFVNPGEEVKQEITPSVPGTFKLYCIPHESLGMVGTVTVS